MVRVPARTALAVGFCSLLIGCDVWPFGPSGSVQGNWHFTNGKSRVFEMSLTQSGSSISGTACSYVLGFIGPAPIREAVVTGDYPRLTFSDPFGPDCIYEMRYDDGQIAGDCAGRLLVRFSRSETGRCQGASPAR